MAPTTRIYQVDFACFKPTNCLKPNPRPSQLLGMFQKKNQACKRKENMVLRVVVELDGTVRANNKKMSYEALQKFWTSQGPRYKELNWWVRPGTRTGQWKKADDCDKAMEALVGSKHSGTCYRYEWALWVTEVCEAFTVEAAACEILSGIITENDDEFQYGFGLEEICKRAGKKVLTLPNGPGWLKQLGIVGRLNQARDPVKIPKRRSEPPQISFLKSSEVAAELKSLGKVESSSDEGRDLTQLRRKYLRVLENANAAKQGLVVFSS